MFWDQDRPGSEPGHQGAGRVGFNLTPVTDRLLQATAHPRSCESEFAEPGV